MENGFSCHNTYMNCLDTYPLVESNLAHSYLVTIYNRAAQSGARGPRLDRQKV